MAGWLALQEDGIFELLRDNEPAVRLDEGDPESLTQNSEIKLFAPMLRVMDLVVEEASRCLTFKSTDLRRTSWQKKSTEFGTVV